MAIMKQIIINGSKNELITFCFLDVKSFGCDKANFLINTDLILQVLIKCYMH